MVWGDYIAGYAIMDCLILVCGIMDDAIRCPLCWLQYRILDIPRASLVGIAILHRCLSRFRPLPSVWFKFSLKGKWHFDVALGCLMFPSVNCLSQFNLDLLPLLPSTPVTLSTVEQSILARDPIAMGLYIVVVSICALIWEEIVFRGFLLPYLTKYMPVWCAILVSSIVFALAHFNVQRMLPLILLGVVMVLSLPALVIFYRLCCCAACGMHLCS